MIRSLTAAILAIGIATAANAHDIEQGYAWKLVEPGTIAVVDYPDIEVHYAPDHRGYQIVIFGESNGVANTLDGAKSSAEYKLGELLEIGVLGHSQ